MDQKKIFEYIVSGRVGNVVLAVLWGGFAFRYLRHYRATGDIFSFIFFFVETISVFFLLTRTRPRETSYSLFDWVCALGGTSVALLFRPGQAVFWGSGALVLFWIGAAGQLLSILSLNWNFAIVPALRDITTSGTYRLVRHPLYASYLFLYVGYLLWNLTAWNVGIFLAFITFMLLRILNEERYLSRDDRYRAYQSRVRWRLVPFVF